MECYKVDKNWDFSLYVITVEVPEKKRSHLSVAEASAKGGATIIQLREKIRDFKEIVKIGRAIKSISDAKDIPLVINDYLEVALEVDAAGLHVGQSDIFIAEARKKMSYNKVIGVSASNLNEALLAVEAGADYLGVGPIFPTPSKEDAAEPIGLKGLTKIRNQVNIPIVAIGGINLKNVVDVIRAGADGVAIISAVAGVEDMEKATFELLEKIKKAKGN